MKIFGAVLFAFIAAIGNALFVYGQKKSSGIDNPFVFIFLMLVICLFVTLAAVPFWGKADFIGVIKSNFIPLILSGLGLFITYIGFNLLYSHYGASQYVLYAVISILTTSIFVGIYIFKEHFNYYHVISVATAVATILFYSAGQAKG
jgi:drug/metabolite transporter (DMT)-like permease